MTASVARSTMSRSSRCFHSSAAAAGVDVPDAEANEPTDGRCTADGLGDPLGVRSDSRRGSETGMTGLSSLAIDGRCTTWRRRRAEGTKC